MSRDGVCLQPRAVILQPSSALGYQIAFQPALHCAWLRFCYTAWEMQTHALMAWVTLLVGFHSVRSPAILHRHLLSEGWHWGNHRHSGSLGSPPTGHSLGLDAKLAIVFYGAGIYALFGILTIRDLISFMTSKVHSLKRVT